jgi:hypothetical protein
MIGTLATAKKKPGRQDRTERSQEVAETDWQVIGEVLIDTGRLALVDPMNAEDVVRHEDDVAARLEDDDSPGSMMTYEVVTNEFGVGVALYVTTGLGDGVYPVKARFEQAEGAMRIAEVRVRFLPHPVLGYKLP